MQLWHILIVAAVGDEAVACIIEAEFLHKALHSRHEVYKEISIAGLQGHHAADLALWHDENVQGVAGFRMIKRQQQVCFA